MEAVCRPEASAMIRFASSHLECGRDAHALQSAELFMQLGVFRVGGQALGGSSHGTGIVAHAPQHANPLAPGHGLSGVASCDSASASVKGF